MKRAIALGFLGILMAWTPGDPPALPNVTVDIQEWEVPWEESRPRDPYLDQQNRVWFVGQRADYVAYFDQESETFERIDLEPGAGPHNVIVDGDGNAWYAGNRAAHIGKIDAETHEITKYAMPDERVRDPHTLIFDQNGDIWFTAQGSNFVGKMTVGSGSIDIIEVPTPNARPYGIVVDSEGRPWFNEFGSYKIGSVDPETMELTEHELPREAARGRRIAVTSDDMVWYVDYAEGYLGRLDPGTGEVKEWRTPGGEISRPYAMAADNRDRLWFVESGPTPNRLVGFNPASEEFFSSTEIESGGGTVRHMIFHDESGTIWFGTDTNTIGRAVIP